MRFSKTVLLCGLAASAAATTTLDCTADNCLRAIRASSLATKGSSDCSSYFLTTVTPATYTSTVTATATVAPVTPRRRDNEARAAIPEPTLQVRQVTVSPSSIPAYASPCSGSVRYSSACSCIGITASTTTLPTPTVVITVTGTTVTSSTSTCPSPSTITLSATTITQTCSTVTIPPSTITLTATTVTVTATTSSPTGSPTCVPAQPPSGTCALAGDYNSGTGPQLWGGAASSFFACAVLCDGEPGCLSFAFDSAATLSCVLFNTVVGGLTVTPDAASTRFFYDQTCFSCSGLAPAPLTDDGCTPSLEPPANSYCMFNALYAGGNLFLISAYGNTAASTGACVEQCLATNTCASISFDGTHCSLYSLGVLQLELQGVVFPVDVGVAGSAEFYDTGCFVCRALSCHTVVKKRELSQRQSLERREAELNRRISNLLERERALEGSR